MKVWQPKVSQVAGSPFPELDAEREKLALTK